MNYKAKNILIAVLLAVVSSCTYDFPEAEERTSGDADFTKMVSVGNSLTAGFMNGALYSEGQENSFVAILAKQLESVGGGSFNQPLVNSPNGCFNPGGGCSQGRLALKITNPQTGAASPMPRPGDSGASLAPFGDKANLNNFGVPGVTLLTALIPATGGPAGNPAYNPYYARIASQPSTDGTTGSTLIGDAAAALANGGTFFTFWLGNNDVLGYATGGASNPAILTSINDFRTRFNLALGTLLAANENAKGVVANIPDVTNIPFFNTVAYNPIPLNATLAQQLNEGYADFNNGIDAYNAGMLPGQSDPPPADQRRPKIAFVAGQNAVVIQDETLPDLSAYGIPSIRQTNPGDLIVLPAAGILGADLGNGPKGLQDPLEDQYVLIPSEVVEIMNRIGAFNAIIAEAVDGNNRLALVDVNSILSSLATTGTTIGGSGFTSSIVPPFGAFSLDGVHPNPRGMAFIANHFIKAINSKFGSRIPEVNPNNYPGNELPSL